VDIEVRMREVEQEIFSRRPEHSVDLALDRMADLVGLLGDPQRACPVIHITGTNGKTSTARMIDALLRSRGLRTGRFTSPHLVSIRERICVDGAAVTPERFVEAYEEILPFVALVDDRHPVAMSFFEVLTGMAFAIFADTPVDVMVLEVGVGGRLDCTNVADGAVAVITPVAIDHTRLLGHTIEEIAGEKAGIIKPGAVAVLAQQPLAAAEVLLRRAAEVGATVAREGVEFGVLSHEQAVGGQQLALRGLRGTYEDIFLPLFGAYQAGNAACALAAVEAFAGVSGEARRATLDGGLVREAFAKVSSPGRLEIIRRSPTIIIDASHNPAGVAATVAAVQETFTFTHLYGVFAASGDKDVAGMLSELEPLLDEIVVTRNSSDRSMDTQRSRSWRPRSSAKTGSPPPTGSTTR
jgi:dihydrofolate synthase/folylpolyglutamate synthase